MTLPLSARERLADLLPPLQRHRLFERAHHTVPIGRRAWRRYLGALADAIEQFVGLLPNQDGDFVAVRAWTFTLTGGRDQILSLLLAMEPFVPFDSRAANDLIRAMDEAVLSSANALRKGIPANAPSVKLRDFISWWNSRESPHADNEILAAAFALPNSPADANAEFRADWVLQHYAYQNVALITRVIQHLDSLGIPVVTGILAGISIIGGLLDCDDPIGAYSAMDTFVTSYLAAPSETADRVSAHLNASEAALRRSRQMATRAFAIAAADGENAEMRALGLADMYKRISEGPFRQYAWALHSMRSGTWEPPPMLTGLRERLIAGGGRLAVLADEVVFPEMRNSEAHETLAWDGIDEEYITESGRISLSKLASAVSQANSFAAGCEAGLDAVRALAIPSGEAILPDPEEPGRMPAWRRARAYFGTNNLQLTEDHMNTRDAQFRVAQLRLPDINPCFQALLTVHRLLPRIETFTVGAQDNPGARITVAAAALRATMPVWAYAISALDRMPFSTFLPANLDSRRRIETDSVATRSVAWIAIDDALDAIDGSPERWDYSVLRDLDARLRVVEIAVSQAAQFAGSPVPRLISVAASVAALRVWLIRTQPGSPGTAESCAALRRLRLQWDSWGPIRRHPLVPEVHPTSDPEPRPAVRERFTYKPFRSI